MKKIIPFILFFAFSAHAENKNCAIQLFSKVYRLESNQALAATDLIQHTNCEQEVTSRITQILSNSSGTVGSDFLKNEISKEFSNNIEISPRKISLLEVNSTIREQLTSGSNLYFLDTKSLNGLRSIGLVEGEQLKAICESCSTFGEKNLKVEISNPLTGTNRSLWFTSKIMAKIKVFKSKRSLSFQQKHLSEEDFYSDEIFSMNPDNIVTSMENIQFYKANKTIIQGAVLSNMDLQAVNLISFGSPANVILRNQNIHLSQKALPVRSAMFGEIIELKNPTTNKIISGKVVDYNKVVIEL